jgi:hypothetical protein
MVNRHIALAVCWILVVVPMGCRDNVPSTAVDIAEARNFLAQRPRLDHSVPALAAKVFAKGKTITPEAADLLAPFAEQESEGETRYVIGCAEVRYHEYWVVTILVDTKTLTISKCDWLWETERVMRKESSTEPAAGP